MNINYSGLIIIITRSKNAQFDNCEFFFKLNQKMGKNLIIIIKHCKKKATNHLLYENP